MQEARQFRARTIEESQRESRRGDITRCSYECKSDMFSTLQALEQKEGVLYMQNSNVMDNKVL